jgi:hypothetical protein
MEPRYCLLHAATVRKHDVECISYAHPQCVAVASTLSLQGFLELTRDHLVFVSCAALPPDADSTLPSPTVDAAGLQALRAVTAQQCRVGDRVAMLHIAAIRREAKAAPVPTDSSVAIPHLVQLAAPCAPVLLCQVLAVVPVRGLGLYTPLVRAHRLFVDDTLASCYELDQTWGVADAMLLNLLTRVWPGLATHTWAKLTARAYDQIAEGAIHAVQEAVGKVTTFVARTLRWQPTMECDAGSKGGH